MGNQNKYDLDLTVHSSGRGGCAARGPTGQGVATRQSRMPVRPLHKGNESVAQKGHGHTSDGLFDFSYKS